MRLRAQKPGHEVMSSVAPAGRSVERTWLLLKVPAGHTIAARLQRADTTISVPPISMFVDN